MLTDILEDVGKERIGKRRCSSFRAQQGAQKRDKQIADS
jgi:hypothetical protein